MPYFILFFSLLFTTPTYSQNSFDVATCWGSGITVPSVHSYYEESGTSTPLRTSANFHLGLNSQYIIGNKFGIETGIVISVQDYVSDQSVLYARMLDAYVPIQILYRIDHPTNPFYHFTILAGPALHRINIFNQGQDFILDESETLFTPCLNVGLRIGGEKRRGGRLEYGLDYQYSMKNKYEILIRDNITSQATLHSTTSLLSFKIVYFFLNKRLSKDTEG